MPSARRICTLVVGLVWSTSNLVPGPPTLEVGFVGVEVDGVGKEPGMDVPVPVFTPGSGEPNRLPAPPKGRRVTGGGT